MSPTQNRRLILIVSLVSGLSIALGLILYALSQNINLFYTPTQLIEQTIDPSKMVRVGGMVVKNSLERNDLEVKFAITDYQHQMVVQYHGILPDLFKEGQGVVALGKIDKSGFFKAKQVLAKHDEKYMPPEIAGMDKMGSKFKRLS